MLYNSVMVRALLANEKGVTRRICKDANELTEPLREYINNETRTYAIQSFNDKEHTSSASIAERTMPICVGDIIYVRETWHVSDPHGDYSHDTRTATYRYKADNTEVILPLNHKTEKFLGKTWNPSLFMPKEAARIFLKVNEVRIEKLQDITEEQAKLEGINEAWAMSWWKPTYSDPDSGGYPKYRETFAKDLWDSTVKKEDLNLYGWNANPYVWVYEFEKCKKPLDFI